MYRKFIVLTEFERFFRQSLREVNEFFGYRYFLTIHAYIYMHGHNLRKNLITVNWCNFVISNP